MDATAFESKVEPNCASAAAAAAAAARPADAPDDRLARRLGSEHFRREYGLKYAYVTGAMYRGIASKEGIRYPNHSRRTCIHRGNRHVVDRSI